MSYNARTRDDIHLDGLGVINQASYRAGTSQLTAYTSGDVRGTIMTANANQVVTNVSVWFGSFTTVSWGSPGLRFAIYTVPRNSVAGTLVASTGDVSGSAVASSINTFALSSPYTVPTNGPFVVAMFAQFTGTVNIVRGINAFLAQSVIGSYYRLDYSIASQTDLPASPTFVSSSFAPWLAIS